MYLPSLPGKICLILLLSAFLLSGTAAADVWTGTVSPSLSQVGGIYQINSSSDLARLAKDVNSGNTYSGKTLLLNTDLDLSNLPWTPIGGSDKQFQGTFRGQNHKIMNLSINQPKNSSLGLFGSLNGAVLTNLSVSGTIIGRDNLGGLAGSVTGGSITNCTSGVYVTGADTTTGQSDQGIGGLIGHIQSGTIITDSSATGNARGFGGQYIGGLVGWIEKGTITSSFATGSVVGTLQSNDGNYIGGLVGRMEEGSISKSYAMGPVTGISFVGGLVGNTKAPISECYATGSVTAMNDYAGGLVGRQSEGLIDNCYATGTVIGRDEVGGLIGYAAGDLKHSYAVGNVAGRTDVGGLVGQENIRPDLCAALNQYVNGTGTNINRAVGQKAGPANGLVYAWNGMQAGGNSFTNPTTIDNQGKDTSISQFWNNFTTTSGAAPWGDWNTGIWTITNPNFPGYRLPVFSWQTAAPVVDLTAFRPVYSITAVPGPGGTINPSGTLTVRQGFDQTYAITANPGYTILGITIDGTPISGVTGQTYLYTFTGINASHVLIATFSPILYNVTAISGSGGTISPAGTIPVLNGSSISFTVTPDIGYNISSVTVSPNIGYTREGNNYTLTNVDAETSITATFVLKTYTISASSDTNGTISPTGNISVIHGANQTFIIIANTSNEIENISIGGTNLTSLTNTTNGLTIAENKSWAVYQFSSLTDNSSIHAYFKYNTSMGTIYDSPKTYNITASAGVNGTITPEGQVTIQEKLNQTFRIDADSGYEIKDVTVNGAVISSTSDNNYTITSDNITAFYTFSRVMADATISANFTTKPVSAYEINATAGSGGSINPAGTFTVPPGTRQNISITADPGYYIDQILLNGTIVDKSDTNLTVSSNNTTAVYLLPPASGNTSISATFLRTLIYHTVTTGKNGEYGYISPFGTLRVLESTSLNFTIQANSGYNITNITVDGTDVSSILWITENTSAWYNISDIQTDHTLHVNFSAVDTPTPISTTHRIIAAADTGGSITPSGIFNVSHGGYTAFTIMPYAGYAVADVTVNGISVGNVTTHNLTNISADTTVQATFSWIGVPSYNITSTSSAGGTISPAGIITVASGYSQTYTMQADANCEIADVLIDGTSIGSSYIGNTSTSYTFTNVYRDHQIDVLYRALAVPVLYTMNITAPVNGSISPSGEFTVPKNSSQSIVINASSGFQIDTLLDNTTNITQASGQSGFIYNLTDISDNHTITVNFTETPPVTYTITPKAGQNGTISPSGVITVVNGSSQSFLITADAFNHVENVTVNGNPVAESFNLSFYIYTIESVTTNMEISANFTYNSSLPSPVAPPVRYINTSAGPGGSINPYGNLTYNNTTSPVFTLTADPGYVIDHISINTSDDYSLSGLNLSNYTLPAADYNATLSAFFRPAPVIIDVPPAAHTSFSLSGTINTYAGAYLTFIIIPDPGYQIDNVTFDGTVISPSGTNTYNVLVSHNTMLLVTTKASGSDSNIYRNITITSEPHGLINPSGSFQVLNGSVQTLTVQAAPDYLISSITANGTSVPAEPGSTQTFGTYNITILSDLTIRAAFIHQPVPPTPASGGDSDHSDNSYPIDTTGTARTHSGTGITTVLLPAGTFGSVLITELPSGITPHASGSYQTGVISVPSYPGSHAQIEFAVPSAILSEQGLSVNDVVLLLYDGSSWIPQTTYYLSENRGALRYVAGVSGFGPFAISYVVNGAEVIAKSTPEPFDPSAVQTEKTASPTKNPENQITTSPTASPSLPSGGSSLENTCPEDATPHLQMANAPVAGLLTGLCATVFLLRKRR